MADEPVDFRNSVFQTLIGKGLSAQQAMGVMYSLMGESGHGLDPSSYNKNDPGGAMGFAQWVGPRRAGLQATAKAMGLAETDPTAQLAYFNKELDGPYKSVIDNIKKNASGTADSTRIWTADFESPKINNWQARFAEGSRIGSINDNGAPVWNSKPVATHPATGTDGTVAPTTDTKPGPPTSIGDAIAKLTKPGGKDEDKPSALDDLAGAFSQQRGGQGGGQSAPMLQPGPDTSQMLAGPSQQLMAQTMAAQRPLSWSTAPYGSGIAGPQAVNPAAMQMGQFGSTQPGLTLNSLSPFGYG